MMTLSRRRFLQTVSATTIVAGYPSLSEAWIHGVSFPFNGGKSQVNIQSPVLGTYPFVNLYKGNEGWGYIDLASYKFDANGYPTDISAGAVTALFEIPKNSERSWATTGGGTIGALTISWLGTGTISVSGLALVSGSLTSATSAGGSATLTPSTNTPIVGVSAIGSSVDYPHDIKVYFTADQALITAGQIFSTQFLNTLKSAKFGALRFLNWGTGTFNGTNDSNATTWASRKPQTYFTWLGGEPRYSWYAGTTTNSGDAYSLTPVGTYAFGSAFPADKQTAIIKWNFTATTTTPTLSWNGGTAKQIIWPNGGAQFAGGHTGRPGSGFYSTVVYDATLDAFLNFGTDSSSEFLEVGVPPEICIELCRQVGAHPDFPTPFLTCDPLTDWIPSLVAACKASASWMVPRIEGPNECWNTAGPFYSTVYGSQRQLLTNGATTNNGIVTSPTYNATGVSYVAHTSMTITIGAHTFQNGSNVFLGGTYSGLFGVPSNGVVTSFTPTTITINTGPNAGTWTSGGTVAPATSDYDNWYGKVISNIGQSVATSYSVSMGQVATQTKYQLCCGCHTGLGYSSSPPACDPRLTAASYVVASGNANNAASNWTTHIRVANYFKPNSYGTNAETTLATAFAGVLFTASVTAGAMTVASIQTSGGTLAIGKTIFGAGVPAGVTITGGFAPNWTLSNSSFTLASGSSIYACSDTTSPGKYIDGINNPAVFTGSVSGSTLTASGVTGSAILVGMTLIYSGTNYNATIITDNGDGTYVLDRNLGTLPSQAMSADTSFTNPAQAIIFANFKSWASGKGVNKLNCYEGGYSPDPYGDGTTQLSILRYAGKLATSSPLLANGMQGYLAANYALVTGLTGGGFTGEFPSMFNLTDRYPSTDAWAVLEDIYQSPLPPQFVGAQVFNQ